MLWVIYAGFIALGLLVLYMNLDGWPARAGWLVVILLTFFLTPHPIKMIGPFGVVVILAFYQSYKNKKYAAGDEEDSSRY